MNLIVMQLRMPYGAPHINAYHITYGKIVVSTPPPSNPKLHISKSSENKVSKAPIPLETCATR